MNYLGHFHLAYPDPMLITGNLLGEYIHGYKAKDDYPAEIWNGVMMHRHIDSYTDGHPAARRIADFFRSDFQKYAPVMSDIAIDYLLASDIQRYATTEKLHDFASDIYKTLHDQSHFLPSVAQKIVTNMSHFDWLTQYRQIEGITKAFAFIISRATYLDPKPQVEVAVEVLVKNESTMREHFGELITDLELQF